MECNREDATQAKEMAIKKFNETDFLDARKFAKKAQQLYPQLEGISSLLLNIELHLSAEKQNGEINWYKVLDVSSKADGEIIKKQYKKRALTHHPDKNREVGAENAFKLVNEAFSILKDKQSRDDYDERVLLNSISKSAMDVDLNVPTSDVPTYSEFVPDIATPTHATPPTKEFNFFPTNSESSSNADRTNDDQKRPEYFNYIFGTKNGDTPSWYPPPPTYAKPSPYTSAYQPFSKPSTFYEVPLQHQPSVNQQASFTSESKFSTPSSFEKKGSKKASTSTSQFSNGSTSKAGGKKTTPSTSRFCNVTTSKGGSKKATPSTSEFCNASTPKDGSSKKALVSIDLKKLKKDLFQIRSYAASHRGEKTFWTECSGCKNKYEYMLIYMKQFLRCADCKDTFQAFEIELPLSYSYEVIPLVASGTDSDGTTRYTFMTIEPKPEPVRQKRKAKGEGNSKGRKPKKSSEYATGVPLSGSFPSLDEEFMRKMAGGYMKEELGRFGGGVRMKEEPVVMDEFEPQRFNGEVKEEPMSDTEMPPFMPFL